MLDVLDAFSDLGTLFYNLSDSVNQLIAGW